MLEFYTVAALLKESKFVQFESALKSFLFATSQQNSSHDTLQTQKF